MSISSALQISLSGIKAASTKMELTTSNISNASVEGYTRKESISTSASLGYVGGGTQVTGFERAENQALYNTLTKAKSDNGLRSTQDNYLQQVQNIYGTGSTDEPTIIASYSAFVDSWKVYASTPESLVNSRQVVQDGVIFTDELKRVSNEVEDLDRQCQAEIDSTLKNLNSYLGQIRDLNAKISQAYTGGLSSGNMEDQRDQLVLQVAELTGVTVLQRDFGQIALYTQTGYMLVDGSATRTLSYDGINVTDASNPGLSLNNALGSGSVEALVKFRAIDSPVSTDGAVNVIQKLRSQLDEIADSFLTTTTTATSGTLTFAQAYNAAATEPGELAASFFVGTGRTDISVNASLLNSTTNPKAAAASTVTDALLDDTRSFSTDGLTVSSVDYASLITNSLVSFQQAANNAASLANTAESSSTFLFEKFVNETAVNVDNELIKLTEFQNAYNASAHAMSVAKELFRTLESLL